MATQDEARPTPDPTISTEALAERLDDPDLTIVDVRPLAAYNGWRLEASRAAATSRARVAFPAPGCDASMRPRSSACSTTKGHRGRTRRSSSTATAADDVARFAARLCGARASTTSASSRPAGRPGRPTRRCRSSGCPNYDKLVHIGLAAPASLDGGQPEAAAGSAVRSCSTSTSASPRSTPRATSRARSTSTRTGSRTRPTGTAARPRRSRPRSAALGITRDTTVILYGRDTEGDANEKWPGRRAGQIAATRALMILRYAGVDDVRLLDGGYDWWVQAGNPLETTPPRAVAGRRLRRDRSRCGRRSSSTSTRRRRSSPTRTARRWSASGPGASTSAQVSGYNYIGPAGRIKGDVWGNCGTDAYHMQHYRNVDNTMRAYPEIAANWAEAGHHARQVGRVLLRHRLAGERDLVLRVPAWLAADRGLRRRLVRVEPGPGQQPDRGRRAGRRRGSGMS